MKLINIPDGHHVVRHCKRRLTIRKDGVVVGIHPDLFYLREQVPPKNEPEKYLSAFYYEFYQGTPAQQMAQCGAALPFQPSKGDAMVRLSATKVREQGKANSVSLRVVHEASHPIIKSKAQILGVPLKVHQQLCADLANRAVVEIKAV